MTLCMVERVEPRKVSSKRTCMRTHPGISQSRLSWAIMASVICYLLGLRKFNAIKYLARSRIRINQIKFNSFILSRQNMQYVSLTAVNSSTLTPMHLRKAKLMFFWVRYPSSAVLKMYFPDIKFNKNNTAQLVKWFSNFR